MESNSNKTIVNFFAEKISYVIKTYFPSNFVTRFISFHSMLIDSGVQNPFAIVNRWKCWKWYALVEFPQSASSKVDFSINSFAFESFKEVVLQDDQRVLNKVLNSTLWY